MTVYEIYDQTIKTRPVGERLQLAKLILNDLSPDEEPLGQDVAERTGEIRDQDHLEELLLAGVNSGPGIEATPEYWENKRTGLLAGLKPQVPTARQLLALPIEERAQILRAQAERAAVEYERDLDLPIAERELTAFTELDGEKFYDYSNEGSPHA